MPSKSTSSFAKVGGKSRPLSTSARVYPSYLPLVHNVNTRGRSMKWVPPMVAAVGVGYGIATYREAQIEKQIAAAAAAQQDEVERKRRAAALMDAYGDRTSIEELEQAMRVYESQQGSA